MYLNSIYNHDASMARFPFFLRILSIILFVLFLNELNGFLGALFGALGIVGIHSLIEQRLRHLGWVTKHANGWLILCLIPIINIVPLIILIFRPGKNHKK